jgi:chemotaxis protein methyltransferase CheR
MIREEELDILTNDLLEIYGYDFSHYTRASLKRRIQRIFIIDKYTRFEDLLHRIRTDKEYLRHVVEEITVNVTEMFRDPMFYLSLRNDILPVLGTYPFIRIWHAGCSTGEEVYSLAIMLEEANLLQKSLLYATDINPGVLEKARKGIFPLGPMKLYSENYIQSGGEKDFSSYYTANYGNAKFDARLSSRMIFSTHNLVSDSSFNEFHLILCRNVLIYFDKELQDRVLTLFDTSMERLSYLALGSRETLKFSVLSGKYKQVGKEKIWRKIK